MNDDLMAAQTPLQSTQSRRASSPHRADPRLQRNCSCGRPVNRFTGECEDCGRKRLQKKLAVGASNDPLEREAERIADEVLAVPASRAIRGTPPRIQRLTPTVRPAHSAPASVERALSGSGTPLSPALRHEMETRFGHDFSRVRVHSGGAAERSAQEINANAYTAGAHIVFGGGRFAPESQGGRRLLAHELTHAVQQSGSSGIGVGRGAELRRSNGLLLRQPTSPPARQAVTFKTEFHPGTAHDHAPTGRWSEVQKDAERRCKQHTAELENEAQKGDKADPKRTATAAGLAGIECACATLPPEYVLKAARTTVMLGLPLAQKHLDHYMTGGGADFTEDTEDVVRRDSGVRAKLSNAIKKATKGNLRVEQSDYAVKDFQYAFGAIDRLDFEVNKQAGLVHLWLKDRYEWHPVGFGYKAHTDDSRRETNCVHAAAVELKTAGAADYWMIGDAVVPVSVLTGGTAPPGKP